MPDMSGIEVCERVLGIRPDLPVIVLTGQGNLEAAVAALRAGAFDFLTKPVDLKLLDIAVERAVAHSQLKQEIRRLRQAVVTGDRPVSVIGSSSAMRRGYHLITRIGASDASVLIHGETGTGKELVARAIHAASSRKDGPFVAINCAAVPAALIESELFGHARGAFTDAKAQRAGLFVEANGGTLFLDEIGELPIEVQPKLLRALQERKVRPVGSNTEIPFDARLLAASNRDLEHEVEEKRFREDLYYRVNVVRLDLPPLRDRGGDVLELAHHFLKELGVRSGKPALGLSAPVADKLLSYRWPGNVRELENCIERAVALAEYETLTVHDLPEKVRAFTADRFVVTADDATEIISMDQVERRYVARVLSLVGGNKTKAAEVLGFDRRTLYRKLERWGIADALTPRWGDRGALTRGALTRGALTRGALTRGALTPGPSPPRGEGNLIHARLLSVHAPTRFLPSPGTGD
jgi:two-component system response regulator HydG